MKASISFSISHKASSLFPPLRKPEACFLSPALTKQTRTGLFPAMSLDLNSLLKDWPHESGAIKVRKVPGLDGREKLQLRIDLGLLQMEMDGRPDGQRPHNCESYLIYHQRRALRAAERGEDYELTPEQCSELQQEG